MKVKPLIESKLSSSKRDSLPDDIFGIPETRSYPMPDEAHVLAAIKMFNRLGDRSKEKELAKNILRFIKKYKMEDEVNVGKDNRFYKYWKGQS